MYMLSGLDFFGKVRERVASLGQRAVGDSFALATSVSRDERMIQLPLELRRCIFEDNDIWDNDLCSLSRVCRAFQFEAERLLYDIIIAKSPADVVVWCKRIIACPRAAPHVYQFDFDINAPGFEPTEYTIFRTNFYLTLSRALKLMTRLRVLCLPDLFGGTLSCFHLFQGCTFKLHTLDSAFPFDDYFIEFLAKQDEITNLQDWGEIDRSERTQVVPLDILPNLLILIASTEDACHILVPNRPITHLDMTFTIPLSLWPVIAISLGPLRVLEIKYIDDFPRILSDLPRSFPELEALQGFDVRTTEVETACYAMLRSFRKLWGLSINIGLWVSLADECDFVHALRDSCPSLKMVDVSRDKRRYVREGSVRRWHWYSPGGQLGYWVWVPKLQKFWDM